MQRRTASTGGRDEVSDIPLANYGRNSLMAIWSHSRCWAAHIITITRGQNCRSYVAAEKDTASKQLADLGRAAWSCRFLGILMVSSRQECTSPIWTKLRAGILFEHGMNVCTTRLHLVSAVPTNYKSKLCPVLPMRGTILRYVRE